MKKLLYILLIILLMPGCTKVLDDLPSDIKLELKSEINVYEDTSIKDIIESTNTKVLNKKEVINTNKVGKKDIEINFIYNKKEYIYKTSIKVVDTVKPKILSGLNKTTLLGEEYNFCDNLIYGDNYDKSVECSASIEVDYNTPGKYIGEVTLTDSSGNKEVKSITLNVIKEYAKSTTKKEIEEVLFSDIKSIHKTDNTLIGIDVSRWQKDIDFKAVKEAGCDFVIIRMGIQSDYDKEISLDANFETNYTSARENGLLVGIYTYSSANNTKMVKKQVKWMIKELKGKTLDLPVAFDWENFNKWNSYNMSFHDINEVYNTFKSELKKNNLDSMLYSSKYYLENIWDQDNLIWLAHYTNKTNYDKDYYIWQLTNNGIISGIDGYVDIDILYK